MKTDRDQADLAMVYVRLARLICGEGNWESALKILDDGTARLQGSPYALNFPVNKAAILAEAGQSAEALALIDATLLQYNGQPKKVKGSGSTALPGSMRQFLWIRACALNGLGRHDEAKQEMSRLLQIDQPQMSSFVLDRNENIRLRAAICMRDKQAAVDLIVNGLLEDDAVHEDLTWLQPAYQNLSSGRDFWTQIVTDPRIEKITAVMMRKLPPEMTDALNSWSAPSAQSH